jgi:hypothetical protein
MEDNNNINLPTARFQISLWNLFFAFMRMVVVMVMRNAANGIFKRHLHMYKSKGDCAPLPS